MPKAERSSLMWYEGPTQREQPYFDRTG